MMATPDSGSKVRPAVKAVLYVMASGVGGLAAAAGKTTWEWLMMR